MLSLDRDTYLDIVAQALDEFPLECCGLLAGDPTTGRVVRYHRCRNAAGSSRVYTVDAKDQLRATRAADDDGLEIIGVVHSHTHTPPYPSPTDVTQAPDPTWHYAIVSLAHGEASLRSYRIVDGTVTEEPVVVAPAGG